MILSLGKVVAKIQVMLLHLCNKEHGVKPLYVTIIMALYETGSVKNAKDNQEDIC